MGVVIYCCHGSKTRRGGGIVVVFIEMLLSQLRLGILSDNSCMNPLHWKALHFYVIFI